MRTRLAAVGEEIVPDEAAAPIPAPPATPWREHTESALGSLLFVALKTLSQKTLIALTNLADMAMIASAFVLWLLIIRDPSILQLSAVGAYALFVLLTIHVRR
jgi:hypothetical protein